MLSQILRTKQTLISSNLLNATGTSNSSSSDESEPVRKRRRSEAFEWIDAVSAEDSPANGVGIK